MDGVPRMLDMQSDKRQFHGLRAHLNALLAAGAVITSREPVRLAHAGRTYTVIHGMLLCDRLDGTPLATAPRPH